MPFDPRLWPTAITIADLLKDGLRMGVHCRPCGRHVVLDPATPSLSRAAMAASQEHARAYG